MTFSANKSVSSEEVKNGKQLVTTGDLRNDNVMIGQPRSDV